MTLLAAPQQGDAQVIGVESREDLIDAAVRNQDFHRRELHLKSENIVFIKGAADELRCLGYCGKHSRPRAS